MPTLEELKVEACGWWASDSYTSAYRVMERHESTDHTSGMTVIGYVARWKRTNRWMSFGTDFTASRSPVPYGEHRTKAHAVASFTR